MLLREEDFIDNEYYVYNRLLFKILGLWDYQTSSKKLIYVCCINIIVIFELSEEIYALFTSKRKIKSFTKLLEITLPTLCFGSCYYNLLRGGTIMKKILYRIKCDWEEITNQPELMILKEYARLSRVCTVVITICFYLYIVFLIFPSFLSNIHYFFGIINETELMLPLRIEFFMKNQMRYYFQLSLQYLCIIILCTVGVANYTMFIAIIQHACAIFNIVTWRVNERFKKEPKNFYYANSKVELANENEWMIDIIIFYKNANEFVNLIKLFYETVFLFEAFLALVFVIIDYFYIFQLLSFEVTKTEGLTNICYVVSSLSVIYAYFFLGQKLIDHNNNVCLTLCQIPFYSLSLQTQKMLLFLIMKCMRLCNLSLKGVRDVSHSLFASLIRLSFSFAMVFYKIQ